MRLLTAHKILVAAALLLAVLLVAWGVVNWRRVEGAPYVLAVGAVAVVPAALYLRKLRRNPPIR